MDTTEEEMNFAARYKYLAGPDFRVWEQINQKTTKTTLCFIKCLRYITHEKSNNHFVSIVILFFPSFSKLTFKNYLIFNKCKTLFQIGDTLKCQKWLFSYSVTLSQKMCKSRKTNHETMKLAQIILSSQHLARSVH